MDLDSSTFQEGDKVTLFVFIERGKEPVPVHGARVKKVDLSVPRLQVRAPTMPGAKRQWNFNKLSLQTPFIVTSSFRHDPPEDVRYFKAKLLSKMGRVVTLQPYEEAKPKKKDEEVVEEPPVDEQEDFQDDDGPAMTD